ncbi:hypothetical protein ACNOYE_13715 [Nannocystaceae bacterium ST9]
MSAGIFADLLNLEVNTIIKSNMTAEKAPSVPFALLDIIQEYAEFLRDLGVNLEPYLTPSADECMRRMNSKPDEFDEQTGLWPAFEQAWGAPKTDWVFTMDHVRNGWDSFERLRIATIDLVAHRQDLAESDRVALARISENCAQLKFIVQGLQQARAESPWWTRLWAKLWPNQPQWSDFVPKTRTELLKVRRKRVPLAELGLDERSTIRKIWEMGTELIVAQTCIQLDGDVITRLSTDLVHGHDPEVRAMLLTVHRESTSLGVQHWKFLIDTATKVVDSAKGTFGRKR